jgi:hypothetical protein
MKAPAGERAGWCAEWDGTELVCDLPPGHPPGVRDHRAHMQFDGAGAFHEVWFDADHGRSYVLPSRGPAVNAAPAVPEAHETWMTTQTIRKTGQEDPMGPVQVQGGVPVGPTKRTRRLRLTLPTEFPQTLAGSIDALARLSTLAAAHDVPADAKLRLTLSMSGKITGGQFRWEA